MELVGKAYLIEV